MFKPTKLQIVGGFIILWNNVFSPLVGRLGDLDTVCNAIGADPRYCGSGALMGVILTSDWWEPILTLVGIGLILWGERKRLDALLLGKSDKPPLDELEAEVARQRQVINDLQAQLTRAEENDYRLERVVYLRSLRKKILPYLRSLEDHWQRLEEAAFDPGVVPGEGGTAGRTPWERKQSLFYNGINEARSGFSTILQRNVTLAESNVNPHEPVRRENGIANERKRFDYRKAVRARDCALRTLQNEYEAIRQEEGKIWESLRDKGSKPPAV